MDNTTMAGMLSQGLDHWVRQSERLTCLSSAERITLIESLLAQQSLSDLLATFASEAAKIVRIRSLLIDCGQPRHIINSEGAVLHHSFELRGSDNHLLGLIHYGLDQTPSQGQLRLLEQYHLVLVQPLRLMLRLEQLQLQVRLDHLTALGNRAYFDEAIGRAVEQHSRDSRGLVLALVDLDRFKQINDTWGHPVGDLVLTRFAHLLQEVIRTTDQAFRLGGDEFALILQPAEPTAWQPVWLRLNEQLACHRELSTFSVGCSMGGASWHPGMSVHQLYELADADLYLHKARRG